MELSFGNPYGLLALLAIPLVIAIHLLQRTRKQYTVSTLFLVPKSQLESKRGAKFDFWRNSPSFWTQIFACLLITWLLLAPRWISSEFRQQVIVIHDASVSMKAFQEERDTALKVIAESVSKVSLKVDWVLLSSDSRDSVVYQGPDTEAFLKAGQSFVPGSGTHSFEDAFRLAAEWAGVESSRVILLTDHVYETSWPKVELYAIGSPVANVGFAGLAIEERGEKTYWRATVRNYSDEMISLNWSLHVEGSEAIQAGLSLDARATKILTAPFPEGAGSVELELPQDGFALDNRIFILKPQPKKTFYALVGSHDFAKSISPVIEAVSPSVMAHGDNAAHIIWQRGMDFPSDTPEVFSIEFLDASETEDGMVRGYYTSEPDTLMDGLNWNALVYKPIENAPALAAVDSVLLWHDRKPLITLREHEGVRHLRFYFDPLQSNALKLPAFLVLLHRFYESCEATLPLAITRNYEGSERLGSERLNLEPEDVLQLEQSQGGELTMIPHSKIARAPIEPGRFKVFLNGEVLMEASTFFSETREADFSRANTHENLSLRSEEILKDYSEEDFLASVWLLLLCGVFVLNWHYTGRGK